MKQKTIVVKENNMPEIKFRAGAVSATIWTNQGTKSDGSESEYNTISLERQYTDKEGNWHKTSSFRVSDLPKAGVVIQKAYEFLVLNEENSFKTGA